MDLYTLRSQLQTTITANIQPAMRGYAAIPKKPQVPCFVVYPDTIAYHDDFDGSPTVQMIVQLLAGVVNTEAAQQTMDAWLGNTGYASMVDAIEHEGWAQVVRMQKYGTVTLPDGATELLSAQLVVKILGDATTEAIAP